MPFGTRPKATKPGELFTTDLSGPFYDSFTKKRYLLIFKDVFSKFRYGYCIREKSDAKSVLEEVLVHAKNLGHQIKELLSDNGGEFDNDEVRRILSKLGAKQLLTAPYTPQQNGSSERDFRTIVEMARTFKYSNSEVNFPNAIWAELVTAAIYVLNRTGKSSVQNKSPYEIWMGKKPRIKHLRIIGSKCYAHIPDAKRKKMDKKAVKGFLVGYDEDERYRIYVKEKAQVILSRDVIFEEKNFGCRKSEIEDEGNQVAEMTQSKEEKEDEKNHICENFQILETADEENFFLIANNLLQEDEPSTYEEAINGKHKEEWKKAIQSELTSLEENGTWELTSLPEGAKAIPNKWVFRIKRNADGSVDKFKARLVVKGFSQEKGVNYDQTFSPVAKLSTIRSVLAIAATEKLHLSQFDVSTTFLYWELEDEIYMKQPEGFNDGTGLVCKLIRSLYGLKQAPRCWNKRFGNFLIKLGFKPSVADPCLFIRERNGQKVILVLFVDDGLVAAQNNGDTEAFFAELRKEFKILTKNADFFLGLEIERTDEYIKINQSAYARKILDRFNFSDCKSVSTPMLKPPAEKNEMKEESNAPKFPYRQAVGALMYLMVGTRPDLAYSVGFLSRFLENPSTEDIVRVKRVLRYIKGTIDKGITYQVKGEKGVLKCYSDADFGGCVHTGRSTSGVVMLYGSGAISWLSQRQAMVTTSTSEAEIVAANEAAKEVMWLSKLFNEIVGLKAKPILNIDSTGAIRIAQNPEFHRRTKHIWIKHFFIRERIVDGDLKVRQIATEEQLADLFTKPLSRYRFQNLSKFIGM